MSFNSDWDVEQYRHDWDSDDQWEVRRQFMTAHKGELPEAKLVCLAQVYANIEFLQCSYPRKVMEQVKALSAELDETVLEKRRQKQHVNFIKEGDGTKCKVKEKRTPPEPDSNPGKRSRWEMPSDLNLPPNRPTASSYFENESSGSSMSKTNSSKIESQSQYSVQQSYYTSTYYNQQQNLPANSFVPDSDRGPGTHHDLPTGIVGGTNLVNNNTRSGQNLVSRTTTISGKSPVNDDISCITNLENRLKHLVELLRSPGWDGSLGNSFLYEMASKANVKIRYEWQEQQPASEKQIDKVNCLVYIDDVLVSNSGPVVNDGKAKLWLRDKALEFTVKKLQNVQVKIVRNDAGQLELTSSDSVIKHEHRNDAGHLESTSLDSVINLVQNHGINPVLSVIPGPLEMLSAEDIAMARTHFKTFILIENSNLTNNSNPICILENSAKFNGRSIEFQYLQCPTSKMPTSWSDLSPTEGLLQGLNDVYKYIRFTSDTVYTMPVHVEQQQCMRCIVKISGIAVWESNGVTRVKAKKVAAATALQLLRSVAFTVVVKQHLKPGRTLSKVDLGSVVDSSKQNLINEAIPEDNVGSKLLRMMGWSGSGGLGRPGNEGIVEPIKAEKLRGREGFGLPSGAGVSEGFLKQAWKVISEYASTTVHWALAFTNEFSKDERAALHRIASKLRLKSVSRGVAEARFLVISQRLDKIKIIEQFINDGGSCEYYTVIPPSGKLLDDKQNVLQVTK